MIVAIVLIISVIAISILTIRYIYINIEEPAFNLASSLTPLITSIGLLIAFTTIRYNISSTKEKNALEFVKIFKEDAVNNAIRKLYHLRHKHLMPNVNKLNRGSLNPFMEKIGEKIDDSLILNAEKLEEKKEELKKLKENENSLKKEIDEIEKQIETSNETSEKLEIKSSIVAVLNVLESGASGVRYGIYDEGLIYNTYGTQFIEIYELTYKYIKRRQCHSERLYINAEWLAVKWTLQRNIDGDTPDNMFNFERAIKHANHGLKNHRHAPDKKKLKPLLKNINKVKYLN
ncbi:DUF4760 domain-containing protein [Providencia hangzhouensis]